MAFCTECGAKLPNGALFCPNCGTALKAAADEKDDVINAEPLRDDETGDTAEVESNNEAVKEENQAEVLTDESAETAEEDKNPGDNLPSSSGEVMSDYLTGSYNKTETSAFGYPQPGEAIPKRKNGAVIAIIVISSVLLLVAVALFIYFDKSSDDLSEGPSSSGEPVQTLPPSPNVAGSGELDGGAYKVAITGAEDFVDSDGDSAIRVYYDFTNNFKFPITAWDSLDFAATQDGEALEASFSWADTYYNAKRNIRPGITIQCSYEFKYNPDGGNIDFYAYSWSKGFDAGTVTATYDPKRLPGAPAPYVIKPVPEPAWTIRLDSSGTLDDNFFVSVLDGELIDSNDGSPAIRVYYEFTNNSQESISLYNALYIHTYQDGISLSESAAAEVSDSDMNLDKEIAPGETITASAVFTLRNETSAVEAEVESSTTYYSIGQTYSISN